MYAAQNGDVATLKVLAAHGADLDRNNNDGNSALALAQGREAMVRELLNAGARGDGALLISESKAGHEDVVEQLLAAGTKADGESGEKVR